MTERRGSRRQRTQLRILFQRSGSTHFVDAETDNLSTEGAYIWTRRRPLDVGTNVSLLLKLDSLQEELMLQGIVTWVHRRQPIGMGIRFVNVDESARRILRDALR